ncbi:hypothetical protein DFH29DRAFT_424417 [Suillus ampliporus]|nr:hypothetical protein DFH29DRAFT_424417 [Suillus ampliporus]
MVFLTKLPCRLAHVLDEGHCPPCDKPHDVKHYPCYYDALYYPQFNLAFFETSERFCTWLKSSLKSHALCCSKCRWSDFRGCVSYDGVRITVCHQQKSLTMTPSEFADASYHHCVVFRELSSREALSVDKCLSSRLDVYPIWFYYGEEIQEQHLSVLLDSVLVECVSRLFRRSVRKNEKGSCACSATSFRCYPTTSDAFEQGSTTSIAFPHPDYCRQTVNSSFLVWQSTLVICMEKRFLRLCVDHRHRRFASLIPLHCRVPCS